MDLERILESLESGITFRLSFKEQDLLAVDVGDNKMDIRFFDIKGVKRLIPKSRSKRGLRDYVDLAKQLEEKGHTINVFKDDKLVLRLGKGAKPGLLSFFGPVQVLDLKTLTKLMRL